jgi:hypothetical protein
MIHSRDVRHLVEFYVELLFLNLVYPYSISEIFPGSMLQGGDQVIGIKMRFLDIYLMSDKVQRFFDSAPMNRCFSYADYQVADGVGTLTLVYRTPNEKVRTELLKSVPRSHRGRVYLTDIVLHKMYLNIRKWQTHYPIPKPWGEVQ